VQALLMSSGRVCCRRYLPHGGHADKSQPRKRRLLALV